MHARAAGNGLQRAALARATNCNLESIRYHESIGVMPDPPRTAAGYRVYGDRHVRGLRFILRARALGFSIEEIRALLQLLDSCDQTCAEVKARTEQRLADVRGEDRQCSMYTRAPSRAGSALPAGCACATAPDVASTITATSPRLFMT